MSSPRVVLITGGNGGLGFEAIKSMLQSSQSYSIIVGGRSLDKVNDAIGKLQDEVQQTSSTLHAVQIDISDDKSIEQAHKTVKEKFGRVDVLINNAGAQMDKSITEGTTSLRDGWTENYNVNVTSTYVFTDAFMDLLFASNEPRLIFIASGTSSLDEAARGLPATAPKPPAGWPKPKGFNFTSYRSSKAATNMMMLEWKRILHNDNVKIFAVSPGFLATGLGGIPREMQKKMGALDPQVGAEFLRDVVEGKRDEDVGKVIRSDSVQPW